MNEWRDVVGYEGLYQVSDDGQIKSIGHKRTLLMKQLTRARDGYKTLGLVKDGVRKTTKVHRVVAQAFHQNVHSLPDVDHINGDRCDNRAVNLRWASKQLNSQNVHKVTGVCGAVGVATTKTPGRFRAHARIARVKRHLGVFNSVAEASAARLQAIQGTANV